MRGSRARLGRCPETDHRLQRDQRRLARLSPGHRERHVDGARLMAVAALDLPAAGLEPRRNVLREGNRSWSVDGDLVVVVEHDQLAQTQMPREADRLLADALLQTAVAQKDVGVMIHHIGAEFRRQPPLGHGHARRARDSLAQGAGRRLDALGMAVFRMAGRACSPLAEAAQLGDRLILVAGEMQQAVEQHRGMAVGQYEAVAVGPVGCRRIEFQMVATAPSPHPPCPWERRGGRSARPPPHRSTGRGCSWQGRSSRGEARPWRPQANPWA